MTERKEIVVGVLSLQGSYHEHIAHLESLFQQLSEDVWYNSKYKLRSREVKKVEDLNNLDGLILPGGESTTMSILLQRNGLLDPLRKAIQIDNLPCWGTCAGLILLSNEITNTKLDLSGSITETSMQYRPIGGLDVQVQRNSFGRQLDSFCKELVLEDFDGELNGAKFPCIFIRAPVIQNVLSSEVLLDVHETNDHLTDGVVRAVRLNEQPVQAKPEVLLRISSDEGASRIVAIKQGNVFGTSFHPELVTGDYRMHKWFIDKFIISKE